MMNAGESCHDDRNNPIAEILDRISTGSSITPSQRELLEVDIFQDRARAKAFDLNRQNVANEVERRSRFVRPACNLLRQDLEAFGNTTNFLETLWHLWLPLALRLSDRQQQACRPFVQGILGGQGTGKTTLGLVLEKILSLLGKSCVSLSLDDLYKTYSDRQKLKERDSRLIWRGPPRTHDIELGIATLDRLRSRASKELPIEIPRFDKSLHQGEGDRIAPQRLHGADIVLFEGWFVGVHPLPISKFSKYSPPLISEADRDFALESNASLYDYIPLWQRLDSLIVLKPLRYEFSVQWRQEAERKRIALNKSGMSDAEIQEFVEYFWRSLPPELFFSPLAKKSRVGNLAIDLIVAIDENHCPCEIYRPSD
jgi:D-glycerate 3-kinase